MPIVNQSYCQVKTNAGFDWKHALTRPASSINWHTLKEKARSWVTCACGNQCAIIPRDPDHGAPLDPVLKHLGGESGFYGAIIDADAKSALNFLTLIETRSVQLIADAIPKRAAELKAKQVSNKTRHAAELKSLRERHAKENKALQKEISDFVENYPQAFQN